METEPWKWLLYLAMPRYIKLREMVNLVKFMQVSHPRHWVVYHLLLPLLVTLIWMVILKLFSHIIAGYILFITMALILALTLALFTIYLSEVRLYWLILTMIMFWKFLPRDTYWAQVIISTACMRMGQLSGRPVLIFQFLIRPRLVIIITMDVWIFFFTQASK